MEELRVVITADASAVPAGVAQATAAVQASADQIAAAQTTAKVATQALAEAQKQLGAAAIAGNAQAASIISEYAQASAEATAALEALTSAQNQNTASTEANTVAQERDTAVTYNRMEAMGAARIAMGALDGSVGMAAGGLARLAGASTALGPILSNLVPYAAIAAGVFILYDLVKGVAEFSEKATQLSEDLGENWLQAALDQLDGFGDKVRADEKEVATFMGDIDKQITKQKEQQLTLTGLKEGPEAEATQRAQMNASEISALSARISLLKQQYEIEKALSENRLKDIAGKRLPDTISPDMLGKMENRPEVALEQANKTKAQIDDLAAQIATLQQGSTEDLLKTIDKAPAKTDPYGNELKRQQIDTAHAGDADLAPAQRITEELQKQLALNLLKEQVSKEQLQVDLQTGDTSRDGTTAEIERMRVLQDQAAISKSNVELHGLEHEVIQNSFELELKDSDLAAKRDLENQKIAAEAWRKAHEEKLADLRQDTEAAVQAATIQEEMAREVISQRDKISSFGADNVTHIPSIIATAKDLTNVSRTAEQEKTAPIKAEQSQLHPELYPKEKAAYDELQKQMDAISQKGALDREKIANTEALQIQKIYMKVADSFNQSFERAFNATITGSKTAGQAFAQMLGQMELQVVDFVAKWILEQVEMWAITKILQATGLQTGKSKQATANTATVISDASTAAATAAAAAAAGGPPAMLAAAAIASGIVLAVGSAATFDTGGMLPHMGYAFNSSGSPERVLSPSQTQNFESMVNNGGSSSRSATLHQTNNFGSGVTPEMLQAHTNQTMSRLRAMIRPEAFR